MLTNGWRLVTCCASCPEVVCSTHAHDSALWYFDLIPPQSIGLVILLIHTYPDALRRQLKDLHTKTYVSACGLQGHTNSSA